jgi:hypothetical protein
MPFITLCGVTGRVYVPPTVRAHPQKHPCRDCFDCLGCSDDRCNLCRPPSVLRPDGDESASGESQRPPTSD